MRPGTVRGVVSGLPSWSWALALAVLGLLGGSVLNVVRHRGPALWGLVPHEGEGPPPGLFAPRSRCPACGRTLSARDLVPIASWAWLRGRCRACGARISPRYPAIEALGLGCGLLAAWAHPGAAALPALLLLLLVLGAAVVDAGTGYLPDALTGLATWTALLAAAFGLSVPPAAAVTGAAAGYLAFRGVAAAYEGARGREGLGRGGAKLLAAGGAWLGPFALPLVVLAAALSGLAFALATGRREGGSSLRFGPHLAAGIVLAVAVTAALPGRVVPPWP